MLYNTRLQDMEPLEELRRQALARIKIEVLEQSRHELCTNLDPRSHCTYLRSRGVLSGDDQERIQNCRFRECRSASTGLLLDIIATKSDGFTELCNSIQEEGTQMFLLEKLNKSLEKALSQRSVLNGDVYPIPQVDVSKVLPLPEIDDEDSLTNGDNAENNRDDTPPTHPVSLNNLFNVSVLDTSSRQSVSEA